MFFVDCVLVCARNRIAMAALGAAGSPETFPFAAAAILDGPDSATRPADDGDAVSLGATDSDAVDVGGSAWLAHVKVYEV